MAKTNKNDIQKGVGLHARRVIAYVVLIIISFFCLFWFYIMFINATRSNGELQSGFTAIPSTNLLKNWNNLVHGTLPIWYGMFNSLIIAACSAVLCTYFSTMTAYAIHAYEFRMKRFIYPFILMIMMIPTQVTALGFIKLVTKMGLENRMEYITFSLHAMKEFIRLAPAGTPVFYLNGELSPKELKDLGAAGLDYHMGGIKKHPEWIKEAHDLGLKVNVWTVDKAEDMKWLIDQKVDFITTNEPTVAQEILK